MILLADEVGGLDERPMIAEMCALCTHDASHGLRWPNGAVAHFHCFDGTRLILRE